MHKRIWKPPNRKKKIELTKVDFFAVNQVPIENHSSKTERDSSTSNANRHVDTIEKTYGKENE